MNTMDTGTAFVLFTLICCITIIIMRLLKKDQKKSVKKEINLKKLSKDKSITRYDVAKLVIYTDDTMQVVAYDDDDDGGYPG